MKHEKEIDVKDPHNMASWFSTYGILTAERILDRFQIHLQHEELITAIKNPRSLYFHLLSIPLKNVFNGIILQQAHDYQAYAQKLFIDFLLSGQNDKEPGSQGETIREDLTTEYNRLIERSEEFSQLEFEHQKLISETQATLINLSKALQTALKAATEQTGQLLGQHKIIKEKTLIQKAITNAMIQDENVDEPSSIFWTSMAETLGENIAPELRNMLEDTFSELAKFRHRIQATLAPYLEKSKDITNNLRSYRTEFFQQILRVTELIQLLPDYHPDPARETENRSSLNFDAHLGE